ncbi:hypothetical protein NLI96_g9424 [Meripilus lineatus]|uniref:Peptidase A1 domain-containing protein n=1 Tax=Meripilus lineatus TaxID=2056292 RepID=A0AAD5YA86_9APHY|nr:hypothetical protein NLI96_g9424 [Physisporinus lineatus]
MNILNCVLTWLLLSFTTLVYGSRIAFKRKSSYATAFSGSHQKRILSLTEVNPDGEQGTLYTATIYVEGKPLSVVVDTGSADLWFNTHNASFSNATKLGVQTDIHYISSTVSGEVLTTSMRLGELNIDQQVFMNVSGPNDFRDRADGLLGLGFPQVSFISKALKSDRRFPTFLENIFNSYPSLPTYTTFQLNRSLIGTFDGGFFTIGELLEDFQGIADSPRLPILSSGGAYIEWMSVLDSVTINDRRYTGKDVLNATTGKPDQYQGKMLIEFDTGTTLFYGSKFYVDTIYGGLPGAKLVDEDLGVWSFPCDSKFNVSFTLGGLEYPINPLDMTILAIDLKNGSINCGSAMRYIPPRVGQGRDFFFGHSFLRNVYSLFNYGNITKGRSGKPYVQLLSTTDISQALADFDRLNEIRIKQLQELYEQEVRQATASPTPALQGVLASDSSSLHTEDMATLQRNLSIIIALLGVTIFLLLILVVLYLVRSRSSQNVRYKAINPYSDRSDKAYDI